jgi:hypothetical protein
VRIARGLVREERIDDERTERIVHAHQLSLSVQSVIPCTDFEELGAGLKAAKHFGIRPMGKKALGRSVLNAKLLRRDGTKPMEVPVSAFRVSAIMGNVPDALWGKCDDLDEEGRIALPKTPETKTIEATIGIRIVLVYPPPEEVALLGEIPIGKLVYQNIGNDDIGNGAKGKKAAWENKQEIRNTQTGRAAFDKIMSTEVADRRRLILDCVRRAYESHYDTRKESKNPIEKRTLHEPGLEELVARDKNGSYFQSKPGRYDLGSTL